MDMNPLHGGRRPYEGLIAGQFGVISRTQAIEAGLIRRVIDGKLTTGEWEIVAPGVYRATLVAGSFRQRCMAAALWSAPEGLVSVDAAGALWQLEGVNRPARVAALLPAPGSRRSRGDIVVRDSADLLPADRATSGRRAVW